MKDISLDEISEEGIIFEGLENRSGFRTIRRGPIVFGAHLAWWQSKNSGVKQKDSLRVDLNTVQEGLNKALEQHSPDMIYRVFQLFVNKSQLNTDDLLFTELQSYLKKSGIQTVLLPYVAQEGHA